ncbi:hypothetical protein N1851_003803 [Merluccius polli]|uniref:Uncharacterized protein n=1 Tax=Merluccius polli TaxID=89951 RepID=A0AA47N9F4_MERPO|nr:hypothetical protein N1851_003803 [Merluccius polli]
MLLPGSTVSDAHALQNYAHSQLTDISKRCVINTTTLSDAPERLCCWPLEGASSLLPPESPYSLPERLLDPVGVMRRASRVLPLAVLTVLLLSQLCSGIKWL